MQSSLTLDSGIKFLIRISGLGLLVKGASLLKTSFVIGSHTAFFSGTSVAVPLVGAYSDLLGGLSMSVLVGLMRFLWLGSWGFHTLAYVIPGFAASLYWAKNNWFVRCAVPLVCFVLFLVHPVGFAAAPYALYWLIPVGLYCSSYSSRFMVALGSTLTAHAIGSVIWLYTIPMTAGMWLALIPVVALERLVFSCGMVVMSVLFDMARQGASQLIRYAAIGLRYEQ